MRIDSESAPKTNKSVGFSLSAAHYRLFGEIDEPRCERVRWKIYGKQAQINRPDAQRILIRVLDRMDVINVIFVCVCVLKSLHHRAVAPRGIR